MSRNRFTRARNVVGPCDVLTLVDDALEIEKRAEFYDTVPHRPDGLVFMLEPRGDVVRVIAPDGACIGVFADVSSAVVHGYTMADRSPDRPRRRQRSRSHSARW